MIAEMECPACGHENTPGAASCAACSTSLNLKFCAACEAANPLAAATCHECGAALVEGIAAREEPSREPQAHNVPVLEPMPTTERMVEELSRRNLLPLRHSGAPVRASRVVGLWVVSVGLAGGAGYYFANRMTVPALDPAPVAAAPVPSAKPAAKPVSTKPAVSIVVRAAPAPKQVPARVTHTQGVSTGAAAAATAAPVAVAEPAAAEPPVAGPAYTRVTHTRPSQAPEKLAEPAPEKPLDNQPAGCAPSVAALGLCPAR